MKSKATIILATAAALVILLWIVGLAGAGPLVRPSQQGGAPTVVSYQGRVTVDGSPYDDIGFFKFAIVDADGTTTYWSNDGTSTGGEEPTNGVTLPVTNGLFNVLLGDTDLTNMTLLDAPVFSGTERYLRVWFSTDYVTFHKLSPDRRIAAVPYALQAQEAVNADTLDGEHADAFADAIHAHAPGDITPQGAGSGLDADTVDGEDAGAFADAIHAHAPGDITPQGEGSGLDADTLDGQHAADLVPPRAMVLGATDDETTLIDAGFSYTGRKLFDTWHARADMPEGRRYLAVVAVDGMVYAIGGQSFGTAYEKANQAYDPVTNSWLARADMPTGRRYLAAAAVDGVVYAIGGESSTDSYETANEAYDPVTNSWSDEAAMPTGRRYLAVAVADGVIYAIGGQSSDTLYETANEAYDPVADDWDGMADMLTGRRHLAAAAVDGVVYAIGGKSSATDYETANEAYDPVTDSWDDTLAAMPTGRSRLVAVVVDGVVYAIGGDKGLRSDDNEAYDPTTNSWTTRASMPTARCNLAATVVDGVIYAIGGDSLAADYETTNEAYTPPLYVYRRD